MIHPVYKRLSKSISGIAKTVFTFWLMGILHIANAQTKKQSSIINMVVISDVHYGITRADFRGDTAVRSQIVNQAMIAQINTLPGLILPADGGIGAGKKVGTIESLALTGDISTKMDPNVQTGAASWSQFAADYFNRLTLKRSNGQPTRLFLVPGNHDISNAIGTAKPMKPLTDPTSMVGIYNLMTNPKTPLTNQTYNYAKHKVNYSRNVGGVHMVFITLWPDSVERIWMKKDLDTVPLKTPVVIFTHDPPAGDPKHFTNPLPPHDKTLQNQFEDLAEEYYKEGTTALAGGGSTDMEQRGWVKFLKAHPNIKALFHGHTNFSEFYTYTGPDNDVSLPVFRVDSPMKGKFSSKDEKLLSFQLVSLNTKNQKMTVRECLWNTEPTNKAQKIKFGKTLTISLKVK